MRVIPLPAFQDNYIWAIIHSNMMICIDPGDAMPVIAYADQHKLRLTHILITHHHFDHINGVSSLLKRFPNVIVYAPEDLRIPFGIKTRPTLSIPSFDFQVIATPGHTLSHVCYYEPRQQWLFSGDTLFSAGCGRVFDGTIEALHQSLLHLKNLPDATKIYCAHEYTRANLQFAAAVEPNNLDIQTHALFLNSKPHRCSLPSTIQQEKRINPFLRTHTPSVKHYAKTHLLGSDDSLSVFKYLREQKNHFVEKAL